MKLKKKTNFSPKITFQGESKNLRTFSGKFENKHFYSTTNVIIFKFALSKFLNFFPYILNVCL